MTQQRRHILIVEDDPDTADLLGQQLESDGLVVEVARNGQEAILKTADQPPDLIIMDVMMPRLDGFETSRFLKAKFRDTFVPIVILTAKDDPKSRAKGAKFGCEDYVTKPYTRKDLLATVNSLLEIGALERTIAAPIAEPVADDEGHFAAGDVAKHQTALMQKTAATDKVVELRVGVAERLLNGPSAELARVHLRRIHELAPNHPKANELNAHLGQP